MKWPEWLMLIRHDTSAYNVLRDKKACDETYKEFVKNFEADPHSPKTIALAKKVCEKFALGISDAETPLIDVEGRQAYETGVYLSDNYPAPDIIFVSPYKRALHTLDHLTRGWPALEKVKIQKDERVIEQDHGIANLYNDWRVFFALNPDQEKLYDLLGPYRYRYPQGENVPDVRARNRDLFRTITRDFSSRKVLIVTHHLNILAIRANQERLNEEEFIRLDKEEKPINCGVTLYKGYPFEGSDGHLKLEFYNSKLYG